MPVKRDKDPNRMERWHKILDDAFLPIADTQLILILIFGLAFYTSARCEISLYHFIVEIHFVVLGLSAATLAYASVHNLYKAPWTLILRTVLFGIGAAGTIFALQGNNIKTSSTFIQNLPATNQIDSVILLPAFCLLEHSRDPLRDLDQTRKDHLQPAGLLLDVYLRTYVITSIGGLLLLGTFAYAIFATCCKRCHSSRDKSKKKEELKRIKIFKNVIRVGIGLVCLVFIILDIVAITILRNWIDGSAWRNTGENPEFIVIGIGQLAPIISFTAVFFTFFNSFKIQDNPAKDGYGPLPLDNPNKKTRQRPYDNNTQQRPYGNDIPMQPLTPRQRYY
ncbi:MAG: hypothetical protein M1829_000456 [Trizodia sp. TS-e1964]|nr:MAG: hypothetical protein M1829_000456 [Trizodia sp. TS-e1964]